MALSTYDEVWGEVLLRCPLAGPALARRWARNAFRQLSERRQWSWQVGVQEFLFPALYATGTVTATFNNSTITGAGTAFTLAMVNRQFRISTQTPVYTITAVDVGAQTLTLNLPWGGNSGAGYGFEIWQAYQTVPTDFRSFYVIYDPLRNWQLRRHVSQEELARVDPQRTTAGPSYLVADYGYDETQSPPLARYEFWPHQKAQYVYPYVYDRRPSDLDDASATLPRMVRGDVLIEMAMTECAKWPGPSADKPNPYFNLTLAMLHKQAAEQMVMELERQDDEIYETMTWYSDWRSSPMAPVIDAYWLQTHAI